MNTKQQAFNLYFQSGLTQQQIADMLDINRKTLYTWIRDGDWKRARHTARHAPTLLVQQYYDQLTAMNAFIAKRTEQPFPTKDEADVMRKLSMVIKHVRTSWTPSDMMDIFTLFQSNLVRSGHTDKATELMPLLDDFVQKNAPGSRSYEPLREYYDGLTEDEEYDRWLTEQSNTDQAVAQTRSITQDYQDSETRNVDANSQINCHAEPRRSETVVTSDAPKNEAEIESQSEQNHTSTSAEEIANSEKSGIIPPALEPDPIQSGEKVGSLVDRQGERSPAMRDYATSPPSPWERAGERSHRVEMGHEAETPESDDTLKTSELQQSESQEAAEKKVQNGVQEKPHKPPQESPVLVRRGGPVFSRTVYVSPPPPEFWKKR